MTTTATSSPNTTGSPERVLHVRTATTADTQACFTLRHQCEAMFRHAGLDQWHDTQHGQRVITNWINQHAMRVVTTHSGSIVACFALAGPDPDFWDTTATDGLHLYKMMIRPDVRGTGIGDAILDYAAATATQQGHEYVRVDCWKTNPALHAYFTMRGFIHVATRTAPGRNSGWLAQRPARDRRADGRIHLTDQPPTPVVGGDRYDDPVTAALHRAVDDVEALKTEIAGAGVGAEAALEQAARRLDTLAREQRHRNGLYHRALTGHTG